MHKKLYIELPDGFDASTVGKADDLLHSLKKNQGAFAAFLRGIGFDVPFDEETKTYGQVSLPVMDTWDVRAESKKLIAVKDLETIVQKYEGVALDEYPEEEIDFIINAATELDSWENHRSEAVKDAYILYHNGGLETDDEEDEDDGEDESDDENTQHYKKNVKAHVIVMIPPDIGD